MISFALSAGILWLLLIVFHEGTSFEVQERNTLIIIGVVCLVGRISALLLPSGWGVLGLLFQVAALYLIIDRLCGYSTRTILKIMISFFGTHMILSMIISKLVYSEFIF